MRLELINTGTELLLGSTLNTHLAWLGRELLALGLRIDRQIAIPDGAVIRDALAESAGRADVVIVTGGLGPTSDDITRELTAAWLGLPLESDPDVSAWITAWLAERGRPFTEAAARQSMVPRGASVLPNPQGTAPGLYVPPLPLPDAPDRRSPHLFLLPGPPRELHPMVRDHVLPRLAALAPPAPAMRDLHLNGIGETQVAEALEADLLALGLPEIGYCARAGEVVLRVFGSPAQLAAAETMVAAAFPQHYFSRGESMEEVVVDLLSRLGQWVSVAESCTGGLVAHRLTNVPGASAVLDRSFVTYANAAKSEVLGVPPDLIAAHGAVSQEVAAAMAAGCLAAARSHHALALTGIAGPSGGSPEKPVGTVWVALASRDAGPPVTQRHTFRTDRATFKQLASQAALDLLRRRLIRMI